MKDAKILWYKNVDSDRYGDLNQGMSEFSQPSGYVSGNTDCDDTDPSIHSGCELSNYGAYIAPGGRIFIF